MSGGSLLEAITSQKKFYVKSHNRVQLGQDYKLHRGPQTSTSDRGLTVELIISKGVCREPRADMKNGNGTQSLGPH